jgi:hypothetical protein
MSDGAHVSTEGGNKFAAPERKTRQNRAAKTDLQHGKSVLKVYPINEDALENMGTLNRDFSILLAGATGFGGFALDLSKDIAMASDPDVERLAFAAGTNLVCWIIAILLAVAAFGKWREKGSRLRDIKKAVTFAE